MALYHVNPETGSTGKCKAEKSCPFGGEEAHFTSMAAAREAFEQNNSSFSLKKTSAWDLLTVEEKVEQLRKELVRPEKISFNYIENSIESIENWESPWTVAEKENLEIVKEISDVLKREPFDAKAKKEAERLLGELREPYTNRFRGDQRYWFARDKSIVSLADHIFKRRLGETLPAPKKLDQLDNTGIIGLKEAQLAGLKMGNYPTRESTPYIGAVEPYFQESIARVASGEKPANWVKQEDVTLLPERERLFYKLHPDSEAYDQKMYLSTAFPVIELKQEMERVGLENVSVSTLDNGREYGNVYTVLQPDGTVRAFSVYEHRNSDSIIINGKNNWNGEELPYAGESKYSYYAEIDVNENKRAAQYLVYFMQQAQKGELADDATLVAQAPKVDWMNKLSSSIPGFEAWAKERGVAGKKPSEETEDDIIKRLDF